MRHPYALELWDRENRDRIAFLDDVDTGTVQVVQRLNGQHTLTFRLAQTDPAVALLSPRLYVRLKDTRVEEWASTGYSGQGSNNLIFSGVDVSPLNPGDNLHIAMAAPLHPYITEVVSVSTSDSHVYVTRDPRRFSNLEYSGVNISRTKFELYRINRISTTRDDSGVIFVVIQCDHHSYDMADRPFLKNARSDLSYSQNQFGGARQAITVAASVVVNDVFSNFSYINYALNSPFPAGKPYYGKTDTTSFGMGQQDFDTKREVSFNRETCMKAFNDIATAWNADTRYNLDGTADLLYFNGKYSNLRVEYAKNLNSITKETDASTLFNVVYSYGAASAWEDNYSGIYGSVYSATDANTRTELRLNSIEDHAKRFRYGDIVAVWDDIDSLVVTGSSANTVSFAAIVGLNAGDLVGSYLIVGQGEAGSGVGQMRQIVSNTTTTITVDRDWEVTPLVGGSPSTAVWITKKIQITDVHGFGVRTGTMEAGYAAQWADTSLTGQIDTNQYVGGTVAITGGTGVGQTRMITVNTNTGLFNIAPDFDTTPDTTSTYEIKATPQSSDVSNFSNLMTVSKIMINPVADADTRVILVDAEEPLTVGKGYDYRSYVEEYMVPSGVGAYTDSRTIKLPSATEANKFLSSSYKNMAPHTIKICETILSSTTIPIYCSLETLVTSVSGQYLITPNEPLSQTPQSYGTTASSITPWARIETLSLKNETSISSWGEIPRIYNANQEHSAISLARDAQTQLRLNKEPRTRYMIRFGDLYEFDYLEFDQDEVVVGDLFNVIDREIIGDPAANAELSVIADSVTTDAASIYSVFSINPGWEFGDDEFKGYEIAKVKSGTLTEYERRACVANTRTQIITEAFEDQGASSTGFIILSIFERMRINEKRWNPFIPGQLNVEVTTPDPIDFYQDFTALETKQKKAETETADALGRVQHPTCYFWNDAQRRCGRTSYPAWFCQADQSNKDGKLTAQLQPITKSHCTAFRPMDAYKTNLDEKRVETTIESVTAATFSNTVDSVAVPTDFVVDPAATYWVLYNVTNVSSTVINPGSAEVQIKTDSSSNVIPYDASTGTGCYFEYKVTNASTPAHLSLSAYVKGSGSQGNI